MNAKLSNSLILLGLLLIIIGVAMIYPPLAWITAGGFVIALAFLLSPPETDSNEPNTGESQ